MTQFNFREYRPDDYVQIQLSRVAKASQIGMPIMRWGKLHEEKGPAATAVDPNAEIVFCLGIHHQWAGCGEVWAVYSPLAKRYPMTLQATRLLIRLLQREFGYKRIQASADMRFPETQRFLKHLGFVQEGLMQAYGPHGEDHGLYALLQGENNG